MRREAKDPLYAYATHGLIIVIGLTKQAIGQNKENHKMNSDQITLQEIKLAILRVKQIGYVPDSIRVNPDTYLYLDDTIKSISHAREGDGYTQFVERHHPNAVAVLFGLPVFVDLKQDEPLSITSKRQTI